MAQQVSGYLAEDGTFFETEHECKRYEAEKMIRVLCESHNVNSDNFFAMINEWSNTIKEYYNADDGCAEKRAKAKGRIEFRGEETDEPEPSRSAPQCHHAHPSPVLWL